MHKLKIAIYHNLDYGGAKISLLEWVRHLKQLYNIQIDYYKYNIVNEDDCDISKYADNTFTYYLFNNNQPLRGNIFQKLYLVYRNIIIDKKIAAKIDSKGYNLVFINHSKFMQTPYVLRFIRRTKTIYFCHEPYRTGSEFYSLYKDKPIIRKIINFLRIAPKAIIDKYNFHGSDLVLCNSKYSKKSIFNYYGYKPSVVHLGVDIKNYKSLKNLHRENKIISTGILLPHKGYELTINAIALLDYDKRPEFHIYHSKLKSKFENSFRVRLIELSRKHKVKLIFHEQKSSRDIAYAYNSSLFAVYAASMCPLGIVALEAMACSTPVIGSKEGGVQETIKDGLTGFLVSRKPEAFASKMNLLIEKPNIRKKLSENCRKYIEDYWSWDASAKRLYNYF